MDPIQPPSMNGKPDFLRINLNSNFDDITLADGTSIFYVDLPDFVHRHKEKYTLHVSSVIFSRAATTPWALTLPGFVQPNTYDSSNKGYSNVICQGVANEIHVYPDLGTFSYPVSGLVQSKQLVLKLQMINLTNYTPYTLGNNDWFSVMLVISPDLE